MGLCGFNRARREAAEVAMVPVDGMSYDVAIAILAQPLLTAQPPVEVPSADDSTPSADVAPAVKKTVRRTTKKTVQ